MAQPKKKPKSMGKIIAVFFVAMLVLMGLTVGGILLSKKSRAAQSGPVVTERYAPQPVPAAQLAMDTEALDKLRLETQQSLLQSSEALQKLNEEQSKRTALVDARLSELEQQIKANLLKDKVVTVVKPEDMPAKARPRIADKPMDTYQGYAVVAITGDVVWVTGKGLSDNVPVRIGDPVPSPQSSANKAE